MEGSEFTKVYSKDKVTKRARRLPRVSPLFMLAVFIPTTLASIYFGLIASDIYISESHFVVRSAQQPTTTSGLGQLLQTAGFSHAQDAASAVNDFIQSRDALQKLEGKMAISKSFGSPEVDRIRRFGGLDWWDRSFENLFKYYTSKILDINLDSSNSITTLKVSAFSAEEAQRINAMLLEMSEELINALNKRIRLDMIGFATTEVESAANKAKGAAVALSEYRTRYGIFDPDGQSRLGLEGVSKLQGDLVSARTELAQLQSASPNSPAIPVLKQRINTLNGEIKSETARVAGAEVSFSKYGPEYERLRLDASVAGKMLEAALQSLEHARDEALRKELYLQRIAEPSLPDYAVEPRRLRSICTTLLLGLLTWGVLGLLLAGVREHHE